MLILSDIIFGVDRTADSLLRKKLLFFLALWSMTVSVMWFYTIAFYLFFGGNGSLFWGGVFLSLIHSACPFIYRKTKSLVISGIVLSLSGLAFQVQTCLVSTGISSPVGIWFSFHPILLAFFTNLKVIIFSVILNIMVVSFLVFVEIYGYLPSNIFSEDVRLFTAISSFVGLDILVVVFSIFTVKIHGLKSKMQSAMTISNRTAHEINNPLSVIIMSLEGINRNLLDPENNKRLDIALKNSLRIKQYIDIARKMSTELKDLDKLLNMKTINIDLNCDAIDENVEGHKKPLLARD